MRLSESTLKAMLNGAPKREHCCRQGSALLLTLACLVLLSILVLVFLISARNERLSSSLYFRGEAARMLREAVVNLVIAQIKEGTSQTGDLWISQPGAIRTYTAAGPADKVYKLYSAQQMVVPGTSYDPSTLVDLPTTASTVPLTGNSSNGALYPTIGTNDPVYTDLNDPVYRNGQWNYPIVDPGALNVVEGFGENQNSSVIAQNTIPSSAGITAPTQIPMPVRWLYLLESGAIAPVDNTGTIQAPNNFLKADGTPDKIVARVAFWTDDETCKLNINTASTGMYWSTPVGRGNDFEEGAFTASSPPSAPVVSLTGLASSPPATNEFQRYPGHPATTSLDVVFDSPLVSNPNQFFASGTTASQIAQKILQIVPRLAWGGSQLGSIFPISPTNNVTLDTDRLYATVDEMFYQQPSSSATTRTQYAAATPSMTLSPQNLSIARFFLTANSRAPEVTSFNTPRVTIWPVDANPANRTVFDKAIAFCSTVLDPNAGKREYLFTRSAFVPGSVSMSIDGTTGYMDGFKGASTNGSQSTKGEWNTPDQAMTGSPKNNPIIYAYLQNLLGQTFPGFGASLSSKFGTDTNQVLTEIYDYIRSTNLYDCSSPTAPPYIQYTGRPWYEGEAAKLLGTSSTVSATLAAEPLPRDPSITQPADNFEYYVGSAYTGQVVPAQLPNGTRGFGRFPTVVGATLIFFATNSSEVTSRQPLTLTNGAMPYTFQSFFTSPMTLSSLQSIENTSPPYSVSASTIRAIFVLSLANPSPGPLAYNHTYDVQVDNLQNIGVNNGTSYFPTGTYPPPPSTTAPTSHVLGLDSPEWSGLPLWATQINTPGVNTAPSIYSSVGFRSEISPTNGQNAPVAYPFVSQNPITVSGSTMNVVELNAAKNPITVQILVDGQAVQTVQMTFPNFTAPVPLWAPLQVPKPPNTPPPAPGFFDCLDYSPPPPASPYPTIPNGGKADWSNRLGFQYNNSPFKFAAPGLMSNHTIFCLPILLPNKMDIARSIELNTAGPPYGDMRLVAGLTTVPSSYFQPCPNYSSTVAQAISLQGEPWSSNGNLVKGVSSGSQSSAQIMFGLPNTGSGANTTPVALRSDGYPGDWDMSVTRLDPLGGIYADCGAFINKAPDCAGTHEDNSDKAAIPYFGTQNSIVSTDNAFSPSRIMPSPGMFGSLPVGVVRGLPWQTLLFRPAIFDANSSGHPGGANPPDHLIMDLFQMPVVQPYAISDPFSTAGKVNLNYQLAPFSYIERSTALRGVLFPEQVIAVPTTNAYLMALNPDGTNNTQSSYSYRYPIDRNSTITLFDNRFANNQPFLTASQICDMPLVPLPQNTAASGLTPAIVNPYQTAAPSSGTASAIMSYVTSFWNDPSNGGAGTADNLRERPYTTIYPRVTTKSNTFEIHMKVQGIIKAKNTPNNQMQANDIVVSEYQGSCIVERFLDPNAATFDPTNPNAQLGPYKFRIVSTRQFSP